MNRVARADRRGRLHYAPLQGATAAARLPAHLVANPATAVLLEADGVRLRSGAILRVWALLPWPWRALGALWLVPRPVRDAAYDWVAARRHRLQLGPLEWRGELTADQQGRFLP